MVYSSNSLSPTTKTPLQKNISWPGVKQRRAGMVLITRVCTQTDLDQKRTPYLSLRAWDLGTSLYLLSICSWEALN